ncbi:MAG: hypothetical protein M3Y33_05290 [Actinomycetota bacterium]|nr:hypothetical protein [Actinomycetota bacterium]
MGVALLVAVEGAGGAELAEGDGVAAGFGEEVAAVAEHVAPTAQPCPGRGEASAAEFPGGGDHLPVVARAAQLVEVEAGAQRPVGDAGGVE